MRHIESHIQQVCLRWARLQFPVCRELLFSVPNGAHLSMVQARILKAEGMTAGVADMLLLHPSADGRWAALAIEFKTAKGKQSTYQKAWQTELEKPGCYRYEVVRSFEQFRDLINNYLREVEEPAEGIKGNLEEVPSNVDLEEEPEKQTSEYFKKPNYDKQVVKKMSKELAKIITDQIAEPVDLEKAADDYVMQTASGTAEEMETLIDAFKAGASTIIDQRISLGYLISWYIQSVDGHQPIWTEEHLKELDKDFILIPKPLNNH